MRKIFLLLTLLVSVCGLATAGEPDAVRVMPTSGQQVVLLFSANPEITYTATGATITAAGQNPLTLAFDDIEFIDFVEFGSVEDVAEAALSLRVTQDELLIDNAEVGSALSIYSLDGRCVLNTTLPDSSFAISRSMLEKGVYIVRINKTTFKILL